jgi:DNA polymerase-3 subunit epsilon
MFTVIDVETTGGKPGQDRITEIGLIVHNGKRVIESFSSLVNPERPIDPYVVGLTGISDSMVSDAPLFEEIAKEILALTEGKIFVGHNVRFDYRLVRQEFKRIGIHFQRKQLCTVRMSQKIFPDSQGHSLSAICKHLDIRLDNAHRALGDAQATAVLLEKLLFNDRREIIRSSLEEGLREAILPPNLDMKEVESLPEEPGVYYFLDARHKPLYIGVSKDIHHRVVGHFSSDLQTKSGSELLQKIHHVSFEVTGDELIAQLLEAREIKRFMPPYNKAQRRKKYRYGVFREEGDDGFERLTVKILNGERQPVVKAASKTGAERAMERITSKHHLFHHMALIPQYRSMESAEEFKKLISERIDEALAAYQYPFQSFFLLGQGTEPDTRSGVMVENNRYRGYGFFEPRYNQPTEESLRECIMSQDDDPDAARIIRSWLRKKKNAEMIPFGGGS